MTWMCWYYRPTHTCFTSITKLKFDLKLPYKPKCPSVVVLLWQHLHKLALKKECHILYNWITHLNMLCGRVEGVNIRKKCTLRQIFFLVVQMMEKYFVTAGFVKRVDTSYHDYMQTLPFSLTPSKHVAPLRRVRTRRPSNVTFSFPQGDVLRSLAFTGCCTCWSKKKNFFLKFNVTWPTGAHGTTNFH